MRDMMGDGQARRGTRAIRNIATIALAIVMLALVSSALLTGPSLDDYWTLYLSDPTIGPTRLIEQRWIQDIRPPLFDGWATLLSTVGFSSVPIARLASNLPVLLLLGYAARRFAKRLPDQAPFYALFLLLMLSAPATIRAFGIYRGDFWQLAAFAVQIVLTRHILFVQQDYTSRRDGPLAVLGIVATIAAITLDYGGALFGGVLAMATMLAAIARGLRRWARMLLLALILSIAAVVYMISWQAPAWKESFDLYQNWIEMGEGSSSAILAALIAGTILHNPIAIAGAWLGRLGWTKEDSAFAILTGAALAAALVAISQIDAQRRLITASNTADIAVLTAALIASAGARIADRRLWMTVLAAVAVLSSLVGLALIGIDGGWQAGAKKIARIVDSCPAAKVYAASGWRLDDGSHSRAAQREEPVFALGYKRLGSAHGFTPILLSPGTPSTAVPNACPTLLWIEQVPHKTVKPGLALQSAGLNGLEAMRLSVIRTSTGLIVRADR